MIWNFALNFLHCYKCFEMSSTGIPNKRDFRLNFFLILYLPVKNFNIILKFLKNLLFYIPEISGFVHIICNFAIFAQLKIFWDVQYRDYESRVNGTSDPELRHWFFFFYLLFEIPETSGFVYYLPCVLYIYIYICMYVCMYIFMYLCMSLHPVSKLYVVYICGNMLKELNSIYSKVDILITSK